MFRGGITVAEVPFPAVAGDHETYETNPHRLFDFDSSNLLSSLPFTKKEQRGVLRLDRARVCDVQPVQGPSIGHLQVRGKAGQGYVEAGR